MEITSLAPEDIVIGNRVRELSRDAVDRLKESIRQLGLRTPISVRLISEEDGWGLVTGRHRLQACVELGMKEVPVREETGSELDARLWEIAENLHRAELTVTERAEHIAEWVRLAEEREQIKAQVAPLDRPHDRGRPNQGINAASRELGIDRTEAQRAVKIDALPPEVKAEAKILRLDDNQSALLKAGRQTTKEDQIRSLREHSAQRQQPRAPQPPARDPLNDTETVERQVDALMRAWNAAGPEARERFLDRIDRPVADAIAALRA